MVETESMDYRRVAGVICYKSDRYGALPTSHTDLVINLKALLALFAYNILTAPTNFYGE